MSAEPLYVVTDVELDGPVPGRHSMLSFASVAVTPAGDLLGEFEAVLERLPGAASDPGTMGFWAGEPEAYAAATRDPEPAETVMKRFSAWVRGLPQRPTFAAHPLGLDGPWMDLYLERFTGERIIETPRSRDPLFRGSPLCLRSFAAGRLGWPPADCRVDRYPLAWLGSHAHTHRAIDDARGYAHLLGHLMSGRPAGPI